MNRDAHIVKCGPDLSFQVRHAADVGHARRTLRLVLEGHRFAAPMLDRVDLVVTELGTNLVRHVEEGGEILARVSRTATENLELELLALDLGCGGASTSKLGPIPSPGRPVPGLHSGLRAVSRLATQTDLYSPAGKGTVVHARFVPPHVTASPPYLISGRVRPLEGEDSCGDGWGYHWRDDRLILLVVDGLGHGRWAQQATEAALGCLDDLEDGGLEHLFSKLNRCLRRTRGAALAAVLLQKKELSFAGVGNLSAWILDTDYKKQLTSYPGIMGATDSVPHHRIFSHPWTDSMRLVIQTDGVASWHPRGVDLAGLLGRDPGTFAGVIIRDCRRLQDDAAVVVLASR